MKLGVFGGTFDPPHTGHLLIGELVRDALGLERLLFVPAGDPPHKQHLEITPAAHRRRLVELAIADNPAFELCPIDLDRRGPHYSTETVRLIREQYDVAADDCIFLLGGDSLVELPTWHQPQRLIELCRLAVVHRPGYTPDLAALERQVPGLARRLEWVEIPLVELSSSVIRRRVRAGRSIRYQTPEAVIGYIEQHELYQASLTEPGVAQRTGNTLITH